MFYEILFDKTKFREGKSNFFREFEIQCKNLESINYSIKCKS